MPNETSITFGDKGHHLRGILHAPSPSGPDRGTGIVFVHGWSGNRAGPHRMFVKTARRLAREGITCLRFDLFGRGESDGAVSAGTIPSMIDDTRCAVEFLRARSGVARVFLLGICSGGKVAIGAAAEGAPVDALVLWSAEPMGALADTARERRRGMAALRAYARKALRPATWGRLLAGKVNTRLVGRAVFKQETADAAERTAEAGLLSRFSSYRDPVLFIYGGNDPDTRTAAVRYEALCRDSHIPAEFHEIAEANHSFYGLDWEQQVIDRTVDWVLNASGKMA